MSNLQPVDSRSLANLIISRYSGLVPDVTNLKIQKSIFIFNAFYLVWYDKSLIKNHFECWDHGPVISSLYHDLKSNNRNSVKSLIQYFSYSHGENIVVEYDSLIENLTSIDLDFLDHTVGRPMQDLYNEVHQIGGPWWRARQRGDEQMSNRIPTEFIVEHYRNVFRGESSH